MRDTPWLAGLYAHGVRARIATGPNTGKRIRTWGGTTHVIMSDGELVEKLAALVPAPRFHLVRYFGILASAAKQRPSIVPVPPPASQVESCAHRGSSEKEKPHRAITTAGPN